VPSSPVRYRFGPFVLSPRRRTLERDGVEVPLIPRYFDLLVLLVERRHEAVHRNEIFERVWSDVVVSDGALTQAVRTLRRTLGDDARQGGFIKTVSRHGYRFVHPDVVEEPDAGPAAPAGRARVEEAEGPGPEAAWGAGGQPGAEAVPEEAASEGAALGEAAPRRTVQETGELAPPSERRFEALLGALTGPGGQALSDDEQRDTAVQLHAFGTGEVLRRLVGHPGQARVRALLRDTRWDVEGAGPVPLMGVAGGLEAAAALVGLRMRAAWRFARLRWAAGSAGTALAGVVGGALGGLALVWSSPATRASAVAVLALIGAAAGAIGGAGVGAGLAAAESVARSRRGVALACCGALGGAVAGAAAHFGAVWTLDALFGLRSSHLGGPFEGLVLGAAAGAGYAWATPRPGGGGMATPHGRARLAAALTTAACCGAAALLLTASGRPMVGGAVNAVARASAGSQLALAPLGALLGEPDFGRATGMLLGAFEGALFGFGLIFGLTRRPRT